MSKSTKGFGDGWGWNSWPIMRDEREAVWSFSDGDGWEIFEDGWEISEIGEKFWRWSFRDWWEILEMGEKFQRWSFKDERADGETEKEEREENKNNERDKREILEEKGIMKYIYIYILKYCYSEFYL